LDSVLKAEEFPTGVTNLDTALTDMNWNDFSHCVWFGVFFARNEL
jgi:hypothetical protein